MAWLRRLAPVVVVVWVALAASAPAPAADWPVKRGPSHEPFPYHYDSAAWKGVPRKFLEDSMACTLNASTTYLIEEDGTVEAIVHEVTRLNSRKGIDKLGEYRNISYDPAFEQLVLNEARVIKPEGPPILIEPRHLQLRDVSTDYQVYDHEKQLIISFPHLEVGDVIEVKWTVRGRNPEYQGQYFGHYNFGDDTYPVVRDQLRIRTPKHKQLKYDLYGGKLEPVIQKEKDGTTVLYTWTATNREPLPQDDDLPPKDVLRMQLSYSTFASWDEVGKWKTELRKPCWDCDADMHDVVKQVTKDLKTPLEKARALTQWVRHNIRYISAGETHDYTPHKPSFIFSSRYGDCKDSSQLLAVMLKEVGVPVALVTLSTRGDGFITEDVPSPWGTHAILLVTIDGVDHWIDTTVSLAGWDFLPRDDRDRLCYAVDEAGIRLLRTPPITAADNRIEQTTRVTVHRDGSSSCDRTVSYFGGAALSQRDSWVEVPPGERRRLTTAELQDANSRSRLISLAIDEQKLMDFDGPVTARLAFEIEGHFTGETTKEGSITDSKVWGKLLAYNLDYDRTSPMEFWAPFESVHRYIIHLPLCYRLESVPESQETRSKWGEFSVRVNTFKHEPHKLEVVFKTRLNKTQIRPQDFNEFRQFRDEVNKYYRMWLELKTTQEIDDAAGLCLWYALNPSDSTTAATLARLYEQHGRKDEARRLLDFACCRTMRDADLWELKVGAAANLDEKEQAFRRLVQLFPHEKKYVVSLGAVLVDRGVHAEAATVLQPVADKGTATLRALACYQLARNEMMQDQAAKALVYLYAAEDADAAGVNNSTVLRFKGRVLEKLGKNSEAIDTYRTVLSQETDSTEALSALIRLNLAEKKTDDALALLRRYTLVVGEDAEGLVTAAEYHLRLERFEDALELAARAREQRFDLRSQAVIGMVQLHRGDLAKAVFHLERGEQDARTLEALLRCYVRLDRLREAEDLLPRAAKLSDPTAALLLTSTQVATLLQHRNSLLREARPSDDKLDIWRNAISHYVCAVQAYSEGQPADTVDAMLRAVFNEGIDYGPAHSLRGLLAVERGRLLAANEEAAKALSLNPQDPRGYLVRGRVRLERGAEGALQDLEKAARLSSRNDAIILHWLATAQIQANQRNAALSTQREAAKLSPDDPLIKEQLNQLEGK